MCPGLGHQRRLTASRVLSGTPTEIPPHERNVLAQSSLPLHESQYTEPLSFFASASTVGGGTTGTSPVTKDGCAALSLLSSALL